MDREEVIKLIKRNKHNQFTAVSLISDFLDIGKREAREIYVEEFGAKTKHRENVSVVQYSQDGEVVGIYPSLAQAAKAVNGSKDLVTKCCEGMARTHRGYIFQYAN